MPDSDSRQRQLSLKLANVRHLQRKLHKLIEQRETAYMHGTYAEYERLAKEVSQTYDQLSDAKREVAKLRPTD